MAEAKQLIAEQNYNDAILILTTVVREEPDRQDEAQELIGEIVRLRNQYNDEYERLINLLYTQKDEATALKVIAQLEKLDKNPNKQTLDDITQAKRTARLIANNKRYRDIMARGLAHLERREYGLAVQVYLEGNDLAKDMFLESGFGNVLTNQVDRAWTDLGNASSQFVVAEPALKLLPTQGAALLGSENPDRKALASVLGAMQNLASLRQEVWAQGRLFKAQNDFLVKNSRQADFYLGYSYLFVRGPTESKTPEGILGAIDRLWTEVMDPWTTQIRTAVEAKYSQAKAAFDQGKYDEAGKDFDGLRVLAHQSLDALTLWNRIAGVDETGAIDPVYKAKLNQLIPLGIWLDHRLALGIQGAQASKSQARELVLGAVTDLDRPALEGARAEARTLKDTFASDARAASFWTSQGQALGAGGFTLVDSTEFTRSWQLIWASLRQKALGQEAGFVDRRGALDYGLLDSRFRDLQKNLAEARTQVEGDVKYPLQASSKLLDLQPTQTLLAKDIGTFVGLYEGESDEVKIPAVLRWPAQGRDLLGRLTAAQTLLGQLLVTARANYAQSQDFKKQGQNLVNQITQATAAADSKVKFQAVRDTLKKMTAFYAQSLALQEDAVFRSESDNQVKTLGDGIDTAYNELVVREVRKLITQGSQQFLDQQPELASVTLLGADNLWKETHDDPNSEVEYWLGLVKNALSVTSGREVSPIDPLYNEVQELLNMAYRDYSQAQEKAVSGTKDEVAAFLNEALDLLHKITVMFPQHKDAKLLSLRVRKALDPENFPSVFKQSFDTAVRKINADPTSVSNAYNELQDYDNIQPGYPGMADALLSFRRKLGLEKAAVDPKTVAEVRSLLVQAQNRVNGGSQAQLREAQALVTQALALDHENRIAKDLIDTIDVKLKPTITTLNATQTQRYFQILQEFTAGQSLQSLSDINRFVTENPGVENNSQVKELLRRIRAVTTNGT